jgi:VanZ family protein
LNFLRNYKFPVTWALIILILSIIPSTEFPEWKIFSFDAAAHIIVYLILTLLMLWSYQRFHSFSLRSLALIAIISIAYGGFIELIQHYLVPGRFGDWLDFVANASGAFLGIVVMKLRGWRYSRSG